MDAGAELYPPTLMSARTPFCFKILRAASERRRIFSSEASLAKPFLSTTPELCKK